MIQHRVEQQGFTHTISSTRPALIDPATADIGHRALVRVKYKYSILAEAVHTMLHTFQRLGAVLWATPEGSC